MEDKIKGAANIGAAVKRYGENSPVPVALHLDHGKNMESVKAAIAGGYTSVMIDGSSLSFEDNVELTREVVKYAHPLGVTVEGELGVLAGVEDHVFSSTSTYTNPLKAVEFFKKTKCDALAISYGTMHGASKGKDVKLRREIPIAIKECMNHEGIQGALVSHGSSTVPRYIVDEINALGGNIQNAYGISKEELKAAIPCGIGKINVDTDIRLAVTRNFRELFRDHPELKEDAKVGGIWKLLDETVNQNARDKSPAPDLAGEVLRAVLNDTRYPATLLNGVALRIRAEREVTRGRAAILKAYYTKLAESTGREHPDIPEEVLQVSLNPDATNVPYLLGRLFSVLEAVQAAANPGINATIRDKYFSGASATPAAVFPVLVNLAQKHLKKLNAANRGLSIAYEKQMTELLSKLGTEYPAHLNLPQQGSFQLGYYFQTQARYQKKEEK